MRFRMERRAASLALVLLLAASVLVASLGAGPALGSPIPGAPAHPRRLGSSSAIVHPGTTLTASIMANPTSGYAPLTVTFNGSASGGTPPYYYNWQFIGYTLSGQSVTQTFTSANQYPVSLYVSDSASGFAQANVTIDVMARVFAVDPTATPSGGNAPLTVSFAANPSGGSGPYSWDWYVNGSGTPILSENFSRSFSSAGVYPVQLVAYASGGSQTASGWCNVTVDSTLPLTAGVTLSANLGVVPFRVTATGSGSGADPPYSFSWSLGDGTSASGASVTHTYTAAGNYMITLTVGDARGHTATASEHVEAFTPLHGTAVAVPGTPNAGATVIFSGRASGGVAPYEYSWSFGDGSKGTGANVSHVYASAGTYNVSYCVNDSVGQRACGVHALTVLAAVAPGFSLIPGVSAMMSYLIVGLIAAAAVGLVAALLLRRRRSVDPAYSKASAGSENPEAEAPPGDELEGGSPPDPGA